MTELGVAIIGGAGFMGYAHSLGWAVAPIAADIGVQIRKTVLVEADEQRAAAGAARHGWESWSTDWREVITRDDIDIVDIVTPPDSHAEIAIAAITAGKHVFVEKPITNDLSDAVAMTEAARAAGIVTQVGFNYRHTPGIRFVKQLLDDGTLGRPLQFRAHYLQDVAILGRVLAGWRSQKSAGGSGVTGDIGSHIIDLANYLVGDITRVNSLVRSKMSGPENGWLPEQDRLDGDLLDDAAIWLAEFTDGAIGSFAASVYSAGRKNRIFFELECTRGSVEFDWNRREEVRLSLVSDPPEQQGLRTIVVSEHHDDVWWPIGGIGTGYVDGTAIQFQKFVQAIVAGTPAYPDFADATHTQDVIDAVLRSGTTGAWVDISRRTA